MLLNWTLYIFLRSKQTLVDAHCLFIGLYGSREEINFALLLQFHQVLGFLYIRCVCIQISLSLSLQCIGSRTSSALQKFYASVRALALEEDEIDFDEEEDDLLKPDEEGMAPAKVSQPHRQRKLHRIHSEICPGRQALLCVFRNKQE